MQSKQHFGSPTPGFERTGTSNVFQGAANGALRGLDAIGDLVLPDDWFEVEAPRARGAAAVAESIAQFAVGFLIPGAGAVGLASKIPAAARLFQASNIAKGAFQGAVADFTAYDGHEERLSNVLTQFDSPALNNAVTQWIAADEDDSEFEGRVKNMLEGAALGVAFDGIFSALKMGVKGIRKHRANGAVAESVAETGETVSRDIELSELVPEAKAAEAVATRPEDTRQRIELEESRNLEAEFGKREAHGLIKQEEKSTADAVAQSVEKKIPTDRKELDEFVETWQKSAVEDFESTGRIPKLLTDDVHYINYYDPKDAGRVNTTLRTAEATLRTPFKAMNEKNLGTDVKTWGRTAREAITLFSQETGLTYEEAANAFVGGDRASGAPNLLDIIDTDIVRMEQANDLDGLNRLITRVSVFKRLVSDAGDAADRGVLEMKEYLDNTPDTLVDNVQIAQMLAPVMEAMSITALYRRTASGAGRFLNTFKKGATAEFLRVSKRGAKGGPAAKAYMKHSKKHKATVDALLEDWGGVKQLRKKLQVMEEMNLLGNNTMDTIAAFDEAARSKIGLGLHFMYASMLSAPTTAVVNVASATLSSTYTAMSQAVGGIITQGSTDPGVHALRGLVSNGTQAFKQALDAFKMNRGVTLPQSINTATDATNFNDAMRVVNTTREIQGQSSLSVAELASASIAGNGLLKSVSQLVSYASTVPGRILQAGDEFAKALSANSTVETNAHSLFDASGLPQEMRGQFVNDIRKQVFKEGALQTDEAVWHSITKEVSAIEGLSSFDRENMIVERYKSAMTREAGEVTNAMIRTVTNNARELAERSSFTSNFAAEGTRIDKILKTVDGLRYQMPILRLFVPFFQTPTNIAREAARSLDFLSGGHEILKRYTDIDLSKVPGLSNRLKDNQTKFLSDYNSGDPVRRNDAVGRVSLGLSFMATGVALASAGNLTGRGPADKNIRKDMENAGWSPYSIRIGNRYVKYNNTDPIGITLQLVADMHDYANYADQDENEFATNVAGISTAIFGVVMDKTFMSGFSELFDVLESDDGLSDDGLASKFGSLFAPSIAAAGVKTVDPALREARGFMETFMKRIPGLSDNLPSRRNMLGEVVRRPKALGNDTIGDFVNMWNPITYTTVTNKKLDKELANLQHGFQPPATKLFGVDIVSFQTKSGQNTYDRWAELQGNITLGGKNLRQRLEKTVGSAIYRKMDNVDKVKIITRYINQYRQSAFQRVLRESPELQATWALAQDQAALAESGGADYNRSLLDINTRSYSF